jgi:hypothetical protein
LVGELPPHKRTHKSGNELFFVMQQLQLLVDACLLKEAAFMVDEIGGLFAKSEGIGN